MVPLVLNHGHISDLSSVPSPTIMEVDSERNIVVQTHVCRLPCLLEAGKMGLSKYTPVGLTDYHDSRWH